MAAPTTAASLFASSAIPAEMPAATTTAQPRSTSPLAAGQESPPKTGRARTDTMIYTEGYTGGNGNGNGRGTIPIPVVRLGARLNEPEKEAAEEEGDIGNELIVPMDVERREDEIELEEAPPKVEEIAEQPEQAAEESVIEEKRELEDPAEETQMEDIATSPTDFEPIDVEMVDAEDNKDEGADESTLSAEVPSEDQGEIQDTPVDDVFAAEPEPQAPEVGETLADTQPVEHPEQEEEPVAVVEISPSSGSHPEPPETAETEPSPEPTVEADISTAGPVDSESQPPEDVIEATEAPPHADKLQGDIGTVTTESEEDAGDTAGDGDRDEESDIGDTGGVVVDYETLTG